MTTKTVHLKDLPFSVDQKIVRGDTFRSDYITHSLKDGTPIDTSAWDITAAAYTENKCGAEKVFDITIEKRLVSPWGYRMVMEPADTLLKECGFYWYAIPTDDGATERTYIDGPINVEGVG